MHDREWTATQVISQERLERLLDRLTFPSYRQAIGYENDHLITLEALKDPSQEIAREPGVELWWIVERSGGFAFFNDDGVELKPADFSKDFKDHIPHGLPIFSGMKALQFNALFQKVVSKGRERM